MNMTPGQDGPTKLAQLVGYQTDGIVSRVLIKSAGGSVTVFAFDKSQELSEHTVPFEAMVHVLDGEALIRVGETDHRVSAGCGLRLPANVPHAVKATTAFKMIL